MRILMIALVVLMITSCGASHVIHDSKQIISLKNGSKPKPGWYAVSGGFLRDMYHRCDGGSR